MKLVDMTENMTKLESWKAIANYVDKSVRTVRRWEEQEGLPIHRQLHQSGARIFAFQHEIDQWLVSRTKTNSVSVFESSSTQRIKLILIPLKLTTDNTELLFIRDAICEDLIADLSTLNSLSVISFSSVQNIVTDSTPDQDALAYIKPDFLIEGSLTITKAEYRINLRLVRAEDSSIIWSTRISSLKDNLIELQQALAYNILRALNINTENLGFNGSSSSSIDNQAAWELLHKARQESLKWHPQAIEFAIELLHEALLLTNNAGLIQSSLGRVYLQMREAGIDVTELPLQNVENIIKELEKSDPNTFFTEQLKGWYNYATGSVFDGIKHLRNSLDARPFDPDTLGLLANCYLITGQNELAQPLIRELLIIDPFTPLSICLPGWAHILRGKYPKALPYYKKMFKLEPQNPLSRLFYVWVLVLNGLSKDACIICDGFNQEPSSFFPMRLACAIANGASKKGDSLLILTEEEKKVAHSVEMYARFTAFAFAAQNNFKEGIYWLNIAVKLGFCDYRFLVSFEIFFKNIQDLDEFKEVVSVMKQRFSTKT